MSKYILAVLMVGAFSGGAFAQIDPDVGGLIHTDIKKPGGAVLGHVSITTDATGGGLGEYEKAWEWDGDAWPDQNFYLDPGATGVDLAASILYANPAFDPAETGALPSTLGTDERLYRVKLCGPGGNCGLAAYLLVNLTTNDQTWYGAPGISAFDRIPLKQNRTLRFFVLTTPPVFEGTIVGNPG